MFTKLSEIELENVIVLRMVLIAKKHVTILLNKVSVFPETVLIDLTRRRS